MAAPNVGSACPEPPVEQHNHVIVSMDQSEKSLNAAVNSHEDFQRVHLGKVETQRIELTSEQGYACMFIGLLRRSSAPACCCASC